VTSAAFQVNIRDYERRESELATKYVNSVENGIYSPRKSSGIAGQIETSAEMSVLNLRNCR
jgi:hypothetical protein